VNGHVVEQLSAFLDGELPEPERTAVAQHLEACAQCNAHLDELAAVDRLAASVPVEAPEGYFDGFASRVRDRVRKPRRRSFAAPMWVLTVAATLLLAVTAPLLLRRQLEVVRFAPPAAGTLAPAPAQAPTPAPSAPPAEAQDRLRAMGDAEEGNLERKRVGARSGRAAENAPAKAPAARRDLKDEAFNAPPATAPARRATPLPPPPAVLAPEPLPQAKAKAQVESDDDARAAGVAGVEEREQRIEHSQPSAASGFATPPESAAIETREVPKAALQKTAPSAAFRALLDHRPATIAEARGLREAWRAFAQGAPEAEADEARVRVIESGREAYRLSSERVDLDQLRRDATAYLKRADAHQTQRVRAVLRDLPR
jgi:hypothetical protein